MSNRLEGMDALDWMRSYLSKECAISPEFIRRKCTFSELGLDSATGAMMVQDLSSLLNAEIDPTAIYDYPTLGAFCDFIDSLYEMEGH